MSPSTTTERKFGLFHEHSDFYPATFNGERLMMAKQTKNWTDITFPDRYARNARLYPSLLVIAPVVIFVVVVAKLELSGLKTMWVGLAAVGGTYWLTQLARDPGEELGEQALGLMGGTPSITILRHCDPRIDAITKARYHSGLVQLVPCTVAPTPDSERDDAATADICYTAWSTHLRNSTRDQKRFHLLFDELVSYGYRRNLLGLRPYGLMSSILACLGFGSYIGFGIYLHHELRDTMWLALCVDLLLFAFWVFRVTQGWVRLTADNYAARLVEAVDDLYNDHSKAKVQKRRRSLDP
jgi:hypothetical protein